MFPTICLGGFIIARGVKFSKEYRYRLLILLAFAVSAVADAPLEEDETFLHGVVLYGVVHLVFMTAFGWSPLKLVFGIFCMLLVTIGKK